MRIGPDFLGGTVETRNTNGSTCTGYLLNRIQDSSRVLLTIKPETVIRWHQQGFTLIT
jgi:hypothetical protein